MPSTEVENTPHAFVPGKFKRGERGGMWPEETCAVCERDPRNLVHKSVPKVAPQLTETKALIAHISKCPIGWHHSDTTLTLITSRSTTGTDVAEWIQQLQELSAQASVEIETME